METAVRNRTNPLFMAIAFSRFRCACLLTTCFAGVTGTADFCFLFLSQPSPFLYLGQISPLRNFLQPFYRISLNIHFSAVPDGISISSGCSPSSCLRHLPTFHLSTTFSVQNTSFALLDLGFSSISSFPGKIGFLVITLPLDFFPHTQTGKSGRAGTGIFIFSENGLNDPVFQRMECNDTDPSSVIQEIDHAVQGIPKHVKLPVELNTYCLKSPLGRMSSCSLYFHGDRTPYDLCQFSGCPDRCLLSGSHNVFSLYFWQIYLRRNRG